MRWGCGACTHLARAANACALTVRPAALSPTPLPPTSRRDGNAIEDGETKHDGEGTLRTTEQLLRAKEKAIKDGRPHEPLDKDHPPYARAADGRCGNCYRCVHRARKEVGGGCSSASLWVIARVPVGDRTRPCGCSHAPLRVPRAP